MRSSTLGGKTSLARFQLGALASVIALVASASGSAQAQDTKRACVDASTEGQTLRKDEKLVEAREQMLLCAREVCPSIVRSHCTKWVREIDDQLPSVVVRAQDGDGSDLTDGRVTIDGQSSKLDGRSVTLNPGEHVVIVERADGVRKEEKVLLADGEKSRLLLLRFPRAPGATPPEGAAQSNPPAEAEARPAIPVGAWVLGGVGVVSLGAFAYFAVTAKSDLDSLKTSCSPTCTDAQTSPGRTKQLVSYVGLGASIASFGGAILWTILSHSGSTKASASASTGPRIEINPVAGGAVTAISGSF